MQSRHRSFARLAPIVALMAVSAGRGVSQTNTTALTGIVTDSTGAVVPEVSISISNPATGFKQSEKTKSKGEYSFDQIGPGTYTVRVSSPGFSDEVKQVELLVSTPLKVNFKLTVGTSEIVEVQTNLAAIETTDASLGKAFNSRQIQSLPFLANNITYLLSLQPGVLALDSGAKTGGLNTDTRTGIVNGARQDQTNITLDGVDNNDQTNGYAFNGALRATRESVEEFRVTTTNANADAGRSSGGQVSLVTRSGTNTLHGSAYEFYRGTPGLANDWFTKQRQLATGQPNRPLKVLQNTYGGSLGLPIVKNKLFFFGAYEGFQQASSQNVIATVPSLPGGGGLILGTVAYAVCPTSAACSSSTTYKTLSAADIAAIDPKCTTSCPAGQGINKAAVAFFNNAYPRANGTAAGDLHNTGSFSFSSPIPLHQITNIARLDYNLTGKQVLFVRGNLQSDNQATALPLPGQPPTSNIFSNNKGIAAGHIWSISSSLSNNFRYGLIRQGTATRGSGSQPYVAFSTLSTPTGTSTSSIYNVTTHNFADDFTITKGRHTIQFGFNDRILINNRYFDAPLLSNATVSANLLATAAIAGKGTSLDPGAFSCADCGTVATSFRSAYNAAILNVTGLIEYGQTGTEYSVKDNMLVPQATVPTHNYRNFEQEYYVQDQWKANSHLTLTAGLRYVYLGTPFETNGQQIAPTISLQTFLQNRIAAQNAGANYTTRISFAPSGSANNAANFWTPQKTNFAPRVAFAYASTDNRTSLRGGFAIAYDHLGEGIIDQYESTSSSLLSLSKTNQTYYTDVNTNPRFTGYNIVPPTVSTAGPIALPATPKDVPFSFLRSINNNIKTPYAETFNLTLQHQFKSNLAVTASYVGRLGRHLVANLDVAQPLNLVDPGSGQTYFQAATALDKAYDAGVAVSGIADAGYFHNLFPNATYTDPKTKVVSKGAQAYYAYLSAGDRGNETDPLFTVDSGDVGSNFASNTPTSQQFRFFYPQTSSIYAQSTVAGSNYNAMQVSMRHALAYGLVYDVNYTYSKSLDQGSSPERLFANLLTNTFNPAQQYAPSDFDVRHNLTGDYTIPLPFGHGRPYLSSVNGLLDRVIGGWQSNGTVHYSTAFPFTAVVAGNYGTNFETSSFFVQTGQVPTGGHNYVANNGSAANYETALKGVTVGQAFPNFRAAYAGEVGQRNNLRADGYFSVDTGFSKSFRTFREQNFRISAEIFNVTNSVRFATPTTNGASNIFGQYTTLLTQPRQMQFSGKYIF